MMTPEIFWIYGLSGSGKTSIAQVVSRALRVRGLPCLVLDGDDLRAGVCSDLGYSIQDRMENIRRAAEVARLACQQGFVVIAALMTPQEALRDAARSIVLPIAFSEIFLNCDYETCKSRDAKGFYARAAADQITNCCGSDLGFDVPSAPDLRVDTASLSLEASAQTVLQFIETRLAWASARVKPKCSRLSTAVISEGDVYQRRHDGGVNKHGAAGLVPYELSYSHPPS